MITELEVVAKGGLLYNIGRVALRAEGNFNEENFVEKGREWIEKHLKNDDSALKIAKSLQEKDELFFLWKEAHSLACKNEDIKYFTPNPIISPFYKIRNPNNLNETLNKIPYYQLQSEKPQIAIYNKPIINHENYRRLIEKFKKDLQSTKPPYGINLLTMLMEKHLSNIPLGSPFDDVSMFRHCVLVSAISGCLYLYLKEKRRDKDFSVASIVDCLSSEKPFLLVGGDLSGIQKFIYTITSKGALRALKGRSFYIELLIEHIINEIIDNLNLTRCNIVFSAGGNFCIVSPNTDNAVSELDKLKSRIETFLFNEFKGELQLHLEYIAFGEESFKNSASVSDGLGEKLEKSKKTGWQKRLKDILKPESPHENCLTTQCDVCFREDVSLVSLQRGDEALQVCEPCYFQYKLGEELLEISEGISPVIYRLSEQPQGDYVKIEKFYYCFRRSRDEKLENLADKIYRINNFNAENYNKPNNIFLPLGIYKKRGLKELTDAVSDFGINRLAVLRMDVDNLGKIFGSAIAEQERTFARISEISNRLNQFFKYHLNYIAEGKEIDSLDIAERGVKNKGRNLMIIYSGGDDVFILGHWLDVIETAFDIRRYFELFTGNRFLTISGGISINQDSYPVYQYARDAEELERLAKRDNKKDSLALLDDRKVGWNSFDKVIERIRLFKKFLKTESNGFVIDEQKLPKTFFYRLFSLAKVFRKEGILVLPKAAYLISRAKFNNCADEDVLSIKEVIMNSNEKEWEITELATLVTLMLMRKGGRDHE